MVVEMVRFYCENCKYVNCNDTSFDKHGCFENEATGIKEDVASITDHSVPNLSKDNMADNTFPCAECGTLYTHR